MFLFFRQSNVPTRSAPLWVFPGEVGEPGTLEYRMHFKDGTGWHGWPVVVVVGVLWWLDDLGEDEPPNKNGGGVF